MMFAEFLTNQEEVELRAKIKALGLEVSEVPSKPSNKHLDQMISSAMAADPVVQSLLSSTAELWIPVITATSSEIQSFKMPVNDNTGEINGKNITDS
ncbi:LOW QUALITY PROTEIN: hypothetical protein CKAN_02214200 [Cinnamomum micranthum f. kanehirae]|uniref:Uncharacterized protein n=1 Tax=Cinnamomum micranthum f. kanehirae TaxID=337451 RepID=A0A443PQB1_9MAGN|nr:LOW QUALITY PROTEIN: hypothetical protein CKAN_02214200 [Cinnamomum micranthum f. kanehirae]